MGAPPLRKPSVGAILVDEVPDMSTSLTVKGPHIDFPPVCVQCQQPADETFEISRSVRYHKRTVTVKLAVPMCATHRAIAMSKNATEQLLGRIGLILGGVAGAGVIAGLFWFWSRRGQSLVAANYLALAVLGVGAFYCVWRLFAGFIAPRYADPDAKSARNAVRITRYSALTRQLRVEVLNDSVAAAIAAANADRMLKQE